MKIAVFDSGLGGLTIFQEILKKITADFIYFADNQNAPYGKKDESVVKKYIEENMQMLVEQGCQYIVLACNTATAIAIEDLRKKYPHICFIGTEPALKKAIDQSDNKKILVTATTNTLHSNRLRNLIKKLNAQEKVTLLALDQLVLFAEGKDIDTKAVVIYLKEKLSQYPMEEYSHIVLGCTHFPLFRDVFHKILPQNMHMIEGSVGVTNQLITQLKQHGESLENSQSITLIMTEQSDVFVDKMCQILNIDKKTIHIQ